MSIRRPRTANVPHLPTMTPILALAALMTACAPAGAGDQSAEETTLARVPTALLDPAVIVAWNNRAYEVAFAADRFLTWKGQRALALVHLAMHDALNAVVPVYRPYAHAGEDPRAHPLAAAAQAAHDVLRAEYPGAAASLTVELAASLNGIPAGEARARGEALGKRAAAALLAARRDDRYAAELAYAFADQPGAYQTTPEWKGFVAHPGFRHARPFALTEPASFRPPPPPPLTSPEYAAAFNEVKAHGRATSPVRTADQTGYAVWWMEFSEGSFNRLTRTLVTTQRTHPWRAARIFALLAMSLFDGYVAVWDAKFHYNHWRPYTAIRQADQDGNPATRPEADWTSLRPAPPFPDYVSAHATGCAASAEILGRAFGARTPFTMTTTTAPPGMPSRRFTSFSAAATECADSRVQIGFHFRYATQAGLALGQRVAAHVAAAQLPPR